MYQILYCNISNLLYLNAMACMLHLIRCNVMKSFPNVFTMKNHHHTQFNYDSYINYLSIDPVVCACNKINCKNYDQLSNSWEFSFRFVHVSIFKMFPKLML